jgi:hypothetical protein
MFFLESSSLSDSHTNVNDHVYEYSCAVTWHGLKLMAERDAERENDGDAIISQWRLDMIPFWNNNHNEYLIQPQTIFRYIKWLKGNHEVFNNLSNIYFLYKFIMEYYTTLHIMIIFMFRK